MRRLIPLVLCAMSACTVKTEKPSDTASTVDTLAEHSLGDTAVNPSPNPAPPCNASKDNSARLGKNSSDIANA
jgi:hypothetical protein